MPTEDVPEIIEAATNGDTDRVRDLLEQGAPIDTRDMYDRTALMKASSHVDTLQLLLDSKANGNAVDNSGKTPLIFAVFARNTQAIALLLAYGADYYIRDKSGKLPVTYAWGAANDDLLQILYNAEPESDIVLAAVLGDLEKVKYLHQQGADINIPNEFGETALTVAISRGHFEIANYLIESGVDVNRMGRYCSPLVSAIQKREVRLIEHLIIYGADVNGMTDYGSPLIAAVTSGDLEIVKLLLDHKANVRLVDNEGDTALSSAVYEEYQEIVDPLLVHGSTFSE